MDRDSEGQSYVRGLYRVPFDKMISESTNVGKQGFYSHFSIAKIRFSSLEFDAI